MTTTRGKEQYPNPSPILTMMLVLTLGTIIMALVQTFGPVMEPFSFIVSLATAVAMCVMVISANKVSDKVSRRFVWSAYTLAVVNVVSHIAFLLYSLSGEG